MAAADARAVAAAVAQEMNSTTWNTLSFAAARGWAPVLKAEDLKTDLACTVIPLTNPSPPLDRGGRRFYEVGLAIVFQMQAAPTDVATIDDVLDQAQEVRDYWANVGAQGLRQLAFAAGWFVSDAQMFEDLLFDPEFLLEQHMAEIAVALTVKQPR